jgi:hypothetical protein
MPVLTPLNSMLARVRGGSTMSEHQQDAEWNVAEWHGKMLIDRDGEKIGRLQDVYVDVENDEPQFATVKEGFIGRHLTFVPLGGITVGPDDLQVAVTKEQVKSAPNIEQHGEELSQADESALSPLRAQLHPAEHRERPPTRSPVTRGGHRRDRPFPRPRGERPAAFRGGGHVAPGGGASGATRDRSSRCLRSPLVRGRSASDHFCSRQSAALRVAGASSGARVSSGWV